MSNPAIGSVPKPRVIELTEAQQMGRIALANDLNNAQARLENYLVLCLEDSGGSRDEKWDFQNGRWILNADTDD